MYDLSAITLRLLMGRIAISMRSAKAVAACAGRVERCRRVEKGVVMGTPEMARLPHWARRSKPAIT